MIHPFIFSFCLGCVVSVSTSAQYIYFNEVYPGQSPNGETSANLLVRDSTYVAFGTVVTLDGYISRFRISDWYGTETALHDTLFFDETIFSGIPESLLESNGEFHALANTADEGIISCELQMYNENYALTHRIPFLVESPDTDQVVANTLLFLPDNNYCVLGAVGFDTIPYNTLPDSDSYAMYLMKIDTLGNWLWSTFSHHSENETYQGNRIFQLANDELLTSGKYGHQDDPDPILIKYSADGEIIDEYLWGNSNCGEGMPDLIPNDNGTFSVIYQLCLDQQEYQLIEIHRMVELHFMTFDPNTMEPETDTVIPIEFLEDWNKAFGTGDACRTEDGGIACTLLHTDLDYVSHNYILKLNAAGETEWLKEYYCADVECANLSMRDLEPSLDGGLVVTGTVNLEPNLAQRQWLLKVDACGDVEDLGCSYPYVGVREVEVEEPEVKIWPNPARELINIEVENGNSELFFRIIDAIGRCCFTEVQRGMQIDISSLPPGIYSIVLCNDKNESFVKRFVRE